MNPAITDNGIPLLTEILPAPRPPDAPAPEVIALASASFAPVAEPASLEFDIPELLMVAEPAVAFPPAVPVSAFPTAPVPNQSQWSEPNRERLEHNISERISRQVLGHIDAVLEQRMRDSLADVLKITIDSLAREIKRELYQTIEEVVTHAVAQEIAILQKQIN